MVISKPPIKRTQGLPASRATDQIKSSTKFKGLPDNYGILLLRASGMYFVSLNIKQKL
jgi:hypothetical protein